VSLVELKRLPHHIAIIMDGNGRWAKDRGLPRSEGHRQGARSVREIVTASRRLGIKALTVYAFSAQNWARPEPEIGSLMNLLAEYMTTERETLLTNSIRFRAIGRLSKLPGHIQRLIAELSDVTADNTGMTLTLCLSYGGREEIVAACRQIAERVRAGELQPDQIDEALIDQYMFTRDLPPVDLLIRTSGEMRLSNFLLWQVAYAELVVTDVLWPDFRRPELYDCIAAYRRRERRFGLTSAQVSDE
jgi:undecaprenyl diphosphate synthase